MFEAEWRAPEAIIARFDLLQVFCNVEKEPHKTTIGKCLIRIETSPKKAERNGSSFSLYQETCKELTMSESTTPYFDTREAANYLRLRPSTLERWRSTGGGPTYRKLGGRVVYAREELDIFAEAGRRVSTADRGPQVNP